MIDTITPKEEKYLELLKNEGYNAEESFSALEKQRLNNSDISSKTSVEEIKGGVRPKFRLTKEDLETKSPTHITSRIESAKQSAIEQREEGVQTFKEGLLGLESGAPKGRMSLKTAAGAVQGTLGQITGAITGFFKPEIQNVVENTVEQVKQVTPDKVEDIVVSGISDMLESIPDRDKQTAMDVLNVLEIFELLPAGFVANKLTTSLVTKVPDIISDISKIPSGTKNIAKMTIKQVDDFIGKTKKIFPETTPQTQIDEIYTMVNNDVDALIKDKASLKRSVRKYQETRNVDITEQLKDPEVFAGMNVENGAIVVDGALEVLDLRIARAMDIKKQMLPIADAQLPNITKKQILDKAMDVMENLAPADKSKLIKRIESQVDALPDEISYSDLDGLRAQFRKSAVNAQGIMKEATEYTALNNATRDLIFEGLDTLPIESAGKFAALNTSIKHNLDTMKFLQDKIDGLKVKGGKLGNSFARVQGAIIGSTAGPLGALVGAEVANKVQSILLNKQLGNKIKKEMLEDLLKNKPDALKYAEDMLEKAKGLPEPKPTKIKPLAIEAKKYKTVDDFIEAMKKSEQSDDLLKTFSETYGKIESEETLINILKDIYNNA